MKITARSQLADFIVVLNDALPETFSQDLLLEFGATDLWRPAKLEVDRCGRDVRNCDVLDMSDEGVLSSLPERVRLLAEATGMVARWAATYEQTTSAIGLTGRTGLGLVRYRPGGFYRAHHDSHTEEIRTVTLIAVLDTAFVGGDLSFFGGDHVVALTPGQVCMFPSTFQYPHSVETVLSGTRYSMITWLN